jgi:TM2 domain-containing membrane protein YozV
MKKKTTVALLALFLGWIGIHRFYLNQASLGIWYLLFFWTGIPFLISLVDFVVFLLMSETEFNRKYNSVFVTSPSHNQNVNTSVVNVSLGDKHSEKSSVADEITKLYGMKEKGIITQEEYELKKKQLL